MPPTPEVIACDRCGQVFDATPKLLRRRIECRCGSVMQPVVADGRPADVPVEGAPAVQKFPEGELFIEGDGNIFTVFLFTPTHLLIRNAPAGTPEKFFKNVEEKGSIDAAVKSKWHSKIELASITRVEARDGTGVIAIFHRDGGKVRKHKRSTQNNVHALLFHMLHERLAPDAVPVVKQMKASELIWGPFWSALLTIACGAFIFFVAMVPPGKTSSTSGKGKALQFIAEFLGPTGVAVVTGAILVAIGFWAWKRITSGPMKEILDVPGRG